MKSYTLTGGPLWARGMEVAVTRLRFSANAAGAPGYVVDLEALNVKASDSAEKKFSVPWSSFAEWVDWKGVPPVFDIRLTFKCEGGHESSLIHRHHAYTPGEAVDMAKSFAGLMDGTHPFFREPDTEAGREAVAKMYSCQWFDPKNPGPVCGKPFRITLGEPTLSEAELQPGESQLVNDSRAAVASRVERGRIEGGSVASPRARKPPESSGTRLSGFTGDGPGMPLRFRIRPLCHDLRANRSGLRPNPCEALRACGTSPKQFPED